MAAGLKIVCCLLVATLGNATPSQPKVSASHKHHRVLAAHGTAKEQRPGLVGHLTNFKKGRFGHQLEKAGDSVEPKEPVQISDEAMEMQEADRMAEEVLKDTVIPGQVNFGIVAAPKDASVEQASWQTLARNAKAQQEESQRIQKAKKSQSGAFPNAPKPVAQASGIHKEKQERFQKEMAQRLQSVKSSYDATQTELAKIKAPKPVEKIGAAVANLPGTQAAAEKLKASKAEAAKARDTEEEALYFDAKSDADQIDNDADVQDAAVKDDVSESAQELADNVAEKEDLNDVDKVSDVINVVAKAKVADKVSDDKEAAFKVALEKHHKAEAEKVAQKKREEEAFQKAAIESREKAALVKSAEAAKAALEKHEKAAAAKAAIERHEKAAAAKATLEREEKDAASKAAIKAREQDAAAKEAALEKREKEAAAKEAALEARIEAKEGTEASDKAEAAAAAKSANGNVDDDDDDQPAAVAAKPAEAPKPSLAKDVGNNEIVAVARAQKDDEAEAAGSDSERNAGNVGWTDEELADQKQQDNADEDNADRDMDNEVSGEEEEQEGGEEADYAGQEEGNGEADEENTEQEESEHEESEEDMESEVEDQEVEDDPEAASLIEFLSRRKAVQSASRAHFLSRASRVWA